MEVYNSEAQRPQHNWLKWGRFVLPLLILGFGILALMARGVIAISPATGTDHSQHLSQWQQVALSKVQTDSGAPIGGKDPSSQAQVGLAAAASQPVGNGLRTDKPAAKVVGTKNKRVDPASVLPDTKKTGVLSNGCLIGYGTPDQCLPAAMVVNTQQPNCTAIRKLFPNGLKVIGSDPANIDKNKDKLACSNGD